LSEPAQYSRDCKRTWRSSDEQRRSGEAGHPLHGKCVKGRVLVFPRAKGSTVGSYILYALRKTGKAPAAMILSECDTIVAVGAIIGSIPTVDDIALGALPDGAWVRVRDKEIIVESR
jgi:predicted aconitase with swiveling domain